MENPFKKLFSRPEKQPVPQREESDSLDKMIKRIDELRTSIETGDWTAQGEEFYKLNWYKREMLMERLKEIRNLDQEDAAKLNEKYDHLMENEKQAVQHLFEYSATHEVRPPIVGDPKFHELRERLIEATRALKDFEKELNAKLPPEEDSVTLEERK